MLTKNFLLRTFWIELEFKIKIKNNVQPESTRSLSATGLKMKSRLSKILGYLKKQVKRQMDSINKPIFKNLFILHLQTIFIFFAVCIKIDSKSEFKKISIEMYKFQCYNNNNPG